MKRFSLYGLLMLFVLCSVSCTKYGKRVPSDLFEALPYERRIELLESENDLAVAIDRVDEAHANVNRNREHIRRAKDRRAAANSEVKQATDDKAKLVAELSVAEAEARVDWLRAQQDWNVRQEELAGLALRCAHARYEQSRMNIARKAKVKGSEKLEPAEFDNQVKECDSEYAKQNKEAHKVSEDLEKSKQVWEKTKTALAQKTFDSRVSPFVE